MQLSGTALDSVCVSGTCRSKGWHISPGLLRVVVAQLTGRAKPGARRAEGAERIEPDRHHNTSMISLNSLVKRWSESTRPERTCSYFEFRNGMMAHQAWVTYLGRAPHRVCQDPSKEMPSQRHD